MGPKEGNILGEASMQGRMEQGRGGMGEVLHVSTQARSRCANSLCPARETCGASGIFVFLLNCQELNSFVQQSGSAHLRPFLF